MSWIEDFKILFRFLTRVGPFGLFVGLLLCSSSASAASYCASAESRGLTATVPMTVGADYNVQTPLGAWWYLGVNFQMDYFEQCMDVDQQGTYWDDQSGVTTVAIIGEGTCEPPQVLGGFHLYQMMEPTVPCPDVEPPPSGSNPLSGHVTDAEYNYMMGLAGIASASLILFIWGQAL